MINLIALDENKNKKLINQFVRDMCEDYVVFVAKVENKGPNDIIFANGGYLDGDDDFLKNTISKEEFSQNYDNSLSLEKGNVFSSAFWALPSGYLTVYELRLLIRNLYNHGFDETLLGLFKLALVILCGRWTTNNVSNAVNAWKNISKIHKTQENLLHQTFLITNDQKKTLLSPKKQWFKLSQGEKLHDLFFVKRDSFSMSDFDSELLTFVYQLEE